jgi:uncharacterized membrane protein
MIDNLLFGLTLLSALGCGLIAGAFFAFSAFVMKALARLPAAQGIAAMQSINVAAISPFFMTALFGTAAACVILAVSALLAWHRSGSAWLLAGSLLYLGGVIMVTRVFNIPRNYALAAVEATSAQGAVLWARFVDTWTVWNHVRTLTALLAAACFMIRLARDLG